MASDRDQKNNKRKRGKENESAGAYIPPAKLRMMRDNITDKSSIAYQKLAWEALKKSIHGLINKVNVSNISIIIKDLLRENIIRGRGLLCRSIIQAQSASPKFTNVYAALIAVVNTKFPQVGELLIKRCVITFRKSFRRNDKALCISAATFIAHLINQKVLHEIIALQILMLLVENPTNDSVEVAIAFLKECGEQLSQVSSKALNSTFDTLRMILQEAKVDKRVQYMIEVMFQIRKDKFKDHPAMLKDLDLIEEGDQFIHMVTLDEALDSQDLLNVFKYDPEYEENERKYKTLSKEILGSSDEGSGNEGDDESDEEEEEDGDSDKEVNDGKDTVIRDQTETNLVAFRRTVYLTITSSLDYQECAHKLLKMEVKPGQEVELCHMFLDCCTQQRTYEKFYGLLAQRFCQLNRNYIAPLMQIFEDSYHTIHRLDTNRLRNVAKFFAHLLYSDALPWTILSIIHLNEEDTTSSSRIFIKILFQELCEFLGLTSLRNRILDPSLEEAFAGLFPRDNPKNARFSINFFTSIGLGGLTGELREFLKKSMSENRAVAKNIVKESSYIYSSSSSSSSSSLSSSSSSSSSSDSD